MKKELFARYAKIEQEFRILEAEKSEVRRLILDDLKKNRLDKVESDYGNFTVGQKTTWVYSPKVLLLQEKLKITQVKEQEKGIAKPNVSEYLLFTRPKDDIKS